MNLTDPRFRYIGATTHSDASNFAKRQKARMKAAEAARIAERTKEAATITPISRARKS